MSTESTQIVIREIYVIKARIFPNPRRYISINLVSIQAKSTIFVWEIKGNEGFKPPYSIDKLVYEGSSTVSFLNFWMTLSWKLLLKLFPWSERLWRSLNLKIYVGISPFSLLLNRSSTFSGHEEILNSLSQLENKLLKSHKTHNDWLGN